MRLRVFPSNKGDCLLLSSAGHHMLCDGGMGDSFLKYALPYLARMRSEGEQLDVVYVSHIDEDHILGVLKMMRTEMDWRVYEYHQEEGNQHIKKPVHPRPPRVGEVWHNSFPKLLGKLKGPIEGQLVSRLGSISSPTLAAEYRNLVTSARQAAELTELLGEKELGIPHNRPFDHGVMFCDTSRDPLAVGDTTLHIVGPAAEDLDLLRDEWAAWIKNPKHEFGSFERVTYPNIASLVLLAEENGRTVLLTGDARGQEILAGLEELGLLDDKGQLHVDVLKAQHHGSEHNFNPEFCKLITADNYMFCGDGAHENPDLGVVKMVIDSRLDPDKRSTHVKADNQFKLWFNANEQSSKEVKRNRHMEKLRELVRDRANGSNQLRYHFLADDERSFVIDL